MKFYEPRIAEIERNFFTLPQNPAAVCAGEAAEAVCVPQGAFGVHAGKPCAVLFLPRESAVCRLLETGEACSVSLFEGKQVLDSLAALERYGTLEAVGLTAARDEGIPFCEEADLVFLVRSPARLSGAGEEAVFLCEISKILRKRPGFKERLRGCC